MSDLEEIFKDAIEKSDKCGKCGVITARIGGDSQAHWCCNCGAKLRGNHPYSAIANIPPRVWDDEKKQYTYLKVPMPEPVAYGIGNTAITGHTNRLMMVRIDIPGGDQYAGAFWHPLVLADQMRTYGAACYAAGYERAANWLRTSAEKHAAENGYHEPDTGSFVFKNCAAKEWNNSVLELADEMEVALREEVKL